jgi:hypothetical protein
MQPESHGPVLETCQTGAHPICVIDLPANNQGQTASPRVLHADSRPETLLPIQSIPHFETTSRQLRSTTNPTPLITALRV